MCTHTHTHTQRWGEAREVLKHAPSTVESPESWVTLRTVDSLSLQAAERTLSDTGLLRLAWTQVLAQIWRLRKYGQRKTMELVRSSFVRTVYWHAASIQIRNARSINILNNKQIIIHIYLLIRTITATNSIYLIPAVSQSFPPSSGCISIPKIPAVHCNC